jgi:hypothetical protein
LSFAGTIGLCGCGGSGDCNSLSGVLNADPSGRWTGVMSRQESDCGILSRGAQFSFDHYVSSECNNSDLQVSLRDEDNREFRQTSGSSFLGDGSFAVQYEGSDITIDISYDNYDGSLADVTQKIRLYVDGKLRCSERYKGQARK